MKYVAPYGSPDPEAPYIDFDVASGEEGSIPPGAAVEHPMREIVAAIIGSGQTPDPSDLGQLLKAIDLRIAQLTGGGPSGGYALVSALRSFNPVYPEVLTADGSFNLSVPSTGQVRIPAGINFVHRGIFPVTTVQQDFATGANKVYHLRWETTGFVLKDLSDTGYNSSGNTADEILPKFDTTFDSMLTHRVMTNGSNVATITPLKNKNRLQLSVERTVNVAGVTAGNASGTQNDTVIEANFSRTPQWVGVPLQTGGQSVASNFDLSAVQAATRYGARYSVQVFNPWSATQAIDCFYAAHASA